MNKPTDRTVFQNAWVVDDLEAACMKWVREMGIGPFFISDYDNVFEDMTYRGEPAPLNMTVALAQAGPAARAQVAEGVDGTGGADSENGKQCTRKRRLATGQPPCFQGKNA